MAWTINFVWMGKDALGALEKFNIFSWRALGHTVVIYTNHFAAETTFNVTSLGLAEGDAAVVDVTALLAADDLETSADNPKTCLPNSRGLLQKWIAAVPSGGSPEKAHIYNMIDLTKSYVGATQRGIVLDLKVGPSKHVAIYEPCSLTRFVSYTRGGNTAGVPENQCIGTMQEAHTLRLLYAKTFETNVTTNIAGLLKHNDPWFNLLTSFHGRAFTATRAGIDVATQVPPDKATISDYKVFEIGAQCNGPFRVFKKAGDQANKSGNVPTTKKQIKDLCKDVWRLELKNGGGNAGFLTKVETAMNALPTD